MLETALALLDLTQLLVDKLGAFDDEFTEQRRQLDDFKIETEGLRQQIETNRWKADQYDQLVALLGGTIATLSE